MIKNLSDNINNLFSIGEPSANSWKDYSKYGISSKDIPELISIATDREFMENYEQEEELYGIIHVWRSLGQLKQLSVIDPLLSCFDFYCDFGDIGFTEIPPVMATIGEAIIEPLYKYLKDNKNDQFARVLALECLMELVLRNKHDLDIFNNIITKLTTYLKDPHKEDTDFNGILVSNLIDLNKVHPISNELIDIVRGLFQDKIINPVHVGDVEDFEIYLGIRKKRDKPRDDISLREHFLEDSFPQEPIISNKVGRNKPCPCGSGKKYKKCCWLQELSDPYTYF